MRNINRENIAVVLGMFETGLGVARSLGRNKIKVIGIDFKNDIGKFSKYVKFKKCPHPIQNETQFINFLKSLAQTYKYKPVLFITSDDFLIPVSENEKILDKYFLINIPHHSILKSLANKYEQYQLSKKNQIPTPNTYLPQNEEDINEIIKNESIPLYIKALDVISWRKHISGSLKGFVVKSKEEFLSKYHFLKNKNIQFIVQEIIKGPDTNHFKVCFYYTKDHISLCDFTLQKIRQNPVFFGVGSVVESIKYKKLMDLGRQLFDNIKYKGVGSAEFKLDEKDNTLKLIELNPRYWQQNSLTEKCGMNFPLIHYLDATGQKPQKKEEFITGIKWINIYMDLESFFAYRKLKMIKFSEWYKSIKGPKIYSDFAIDDILPFFYEIRFGLKILLFPIKKILRIFT